MGGGSQINRFAVKWEILVRSGDDREVIFAETAAEAEATPDLFALAEQAMSAWPAPGRPLRFGRHRSRPRAGGTRPDRRRSISGVFVP